MTYEEWEAQVPADIKGDRLWELELYRLALSPNSLSLLIRPNAKPFEKKQQHIRSFCRILPAPGPQ